MFTLRRALAIATIVVSLPLTLNTAHAAPISVNFSNDDFEDDGLLGGDGGFQPTIADWDTSADVGEGAFNPGVGQISPETPNGSDVVVFFSGSTGVMQQSLVDGGSAAINVGADQVWVFDFSLGRRADAVGNGTGSVTAALRTGGSDVVSDVRDRDHQTGGTVAPDASDGTWTAQSVALYTGTSPAAGAGELQFRSGGTGQTLLDAISGTVYDNMGSLDITNEGFETDILADGGFNTNIAGWDDPGGQEGAFNPVASDITGEAIEGANVAFLAASGAITQDLFFDNGNEVLVLSDQTYLINAAIGSRSGTNAANGSLIVEILDESGLVVGSDSLDASTIESDNWISATFAIDLAGNATGLGDQARLRFRSTTTGAGQIMLDNVSAFASLPPTIPEPSAGILAGLGIMGFGLCRRRRRNASRESSVSRTSKTGSLAALFVAFTVVGTSASTSSAAILAYDPSANTAAGFFDYSGSIGLQFTANESGFVTRLGITNNRNPLEAGYTTRLWRVSDGTQIASVAFTAGQAPAISGIAPFDWATYLQTPDGGPVIIEEGQDYIIASEGYGGVPRRYIDSPNNIVAGAPFTHVQSLFGAAGSMPNTVDVAFIKYAGPSFEFQALAPEPSTFVLTGLGLLGLGLSRTRRTRS